MIQSSNLTFIKFELGDLGIPVASSQGVSSSNNFHVLHIRARGFRNSRGPVSTRAWQQQLQCPLKQSQGIWEFKWSFFRPCIATTTLLYTNLEPGWCPVLDSAKSVSSGWRSLHRWATCMLADMADISTDADSHGPAASSSATHRQLGARWYGLLGYLKVAGLCEQQLQDVQGLVIDTCYQDIDISIWRMAGEKLDLTISGHLTATGLKKRIASEWAIQVFSLQLAIGSTFLRDSDVIAEFVSSTERVVTAVVSARASQDRDQSTELNDLIRVKLENVKPYMGFGQHQHVMMLWEESCHRAQESCEAAACVLAGLSHGVVHTRLGDRDAKETVKAARLQIRNAVVKRVEGWQVCNTFQNPKTMCVFEMLAGEAGCDANTPSQLMNGARRFEEEVWRRARPPVALDIVRVAGGPVEDEVRSTVHRPVGVNILNVAARQDRGY